MLRQVSTAALNVTHVKDGERLVLIEDKQVFTDGRERTRDFDWSIAEKLAPGENPVDAARRALKEELDIQGKTKFAQGETKEKERTSPSYPGLTSRYTTHYFNVNLNDDQFKPKGYIEQQPDKTTYWVWEKA